VELKSEPMVLKPYQTGTGYSLNIAVFQCWVALDFYDVPLLVPVLKGNWNCSSCGSTQEWNLESNFGSGSSKEFPIPLWIWVLKIKSGLYIFVPKFQV
jgi:hypothetical protein